jgi:hypothetical protein
MLIDFNLVPAGISSRKQVDELNALNDRLTERLVDRIIIPEGQSCFRASNYIRVYLQAHLRRMLQLLEGALVNFFESRGVVALMCARGLYEGLATISDFEKELLPLVEAGDLEAIFQFTKNKAHATKLPNLIERANDPGVTAKNVLTMIEKLKQVRTNIPKEYAFLSEIAHPNGIGAVGFFAKMNNPEDVAYFSDSGPDVHADLQWIFVASYLLSNFEQVMNRIEALLPALTAKGEREWPGRSAG